MVERRKKKFSWHEFRVGFFVIGSFVILIFMLFRVSGGRGFFTPKFTAVTYLPSIQGMKPGAPVWLNGIEIGNVDAIVLEPTLPDTRANRETLAQIRLGETDITRCKENIVSVNYHLTELKTTLSRAKSSEISKIKENIRIEEDRLSALQHDLVKLQSDLKTTRSNLQSIKLVLKIENEYAGWIKKDSEVSIGSIGLLGDNYVDISIGRLDELPSRTSEGYIFIEGINEATIRQLLVSANDLVANFGDISERVKSIMSKVDKGEGTIGQLINSSLLHDSLLVSVRDLDSTIQKAGLVMSDIHESDGTLGQLIRNKDLYIEIKDTVIGLKAFVNKLNKSEGTVNRLIMDPELYNNLKEITVKIDRIVARIDQGEGTLGKLSKDDSFFVEARDSLKKIHSILEQIDQGQGSIGLLLKDRKLYDNLNDALSELVKFVYDLRKNPKKYLHLKFELF